MWGIYIYIYILYTVYRIQVDPIGNVAQHLAPRPGFRTRPAEKTSGVKDIFAIQSQDPFSCDFPLN